MPRKDIRAFCWIRGSFLNRYQSSSCWSRNLSKLLPCTHQRACPQEHDSHADWYSGTAMPMIWSTRYLWEESRLPFKTFSISWCRFNPDLPMQCIRCSPSWYIPKWVSVLSLVGLPEGCGRPSWKQGTKRRIRTYPALIFRGHVTFAFSTRATFCPLIVRLSTT